MSTPISIVGLVKKFPGAASPAVNGVSLEIAKGELFFLLGPSGCGKTTLLRMIAGFTEPTSGKMLFGSRDVTDAPPNKRNTGMVFQSYALWPHMTVEGNVAFGLNIRSIGAEERQRRVREALAAVRMEEYAARKPNQLSGGQQQRVALARAMVIRPDVLLLDEPLSNLDAKLRIELRSEIRRICKQADITTVYVTHDQKEALSMADRVAIMSEGIVQQLGTPADLYRRPNSRFVAEFLGETNFLEGVVVGPAVGPNLPPTAVAVDTAAGRLVAAAPPHGTGTANVGTKLLCSIRPEAWRLGPQNGVNSVQGTVQATIYLGEIAQHSIRVREANDIRVVEINPVFGSITQGNHIAATLDPADVVLLPR